MGFSKGDDLKSGGYLDTLQAEEGDLLLIRSNCTIYKPQIFFDSNRNGTIDWDTDELIFGEQRFDDINPSYSDIITIHKKGTYFLMLVDPECHLEFYHMKNRYNIISSEPTKIRVPKLAGKYLGIAENEGCPISIPVELFVNAGEPASLLLSAPNCTTTSMPFDIEFEVQDRFQNPVEENITALVEFCNATKTVEIIEGNSSVSLTAPDKAGIYEIKAQSQYGVVDKDIRVAPMTTNETTSTTSETADMNANDSMKSEEALEVSKAGKNVSLAMAGNAPEKIKSISVSTKNGYINLAWQPCTDAEYYSVYRLNYSLDYTYTKLANVKNPEYSLKGEFWESRTFRVSAVNSEGNESELSDPVGIVVTP